MKLGTTIALTVAAAAIAQAAPAKTPRGVMNALEKSLTETPTIKTSIDAPAQDEPAVLTAASSSNSDPPKPKAAFQRGFLDRAYKKPPGSGSKTSTLDKSLKEQLSSKIAEEGDSSTNAASKAKVSGAGSGSKIPQVTTSTTQKFIKTSDPAPEMIPAYRLLALEPSEQVDKQAPFAPQMYPSLGVELTGEGARYWHRGYHVATISHQPGVTISKPTFSPELKDHNVKMVISNNAKKAKRKYTKGVEEYKKILEALGLSA